MRHAHFAALRPRCPLCRNGELTISRATVERCDELLEGILTCADRACRREYPVIDGIPILVAPIRAWLGANPMQLLMRNDLSEEIESVVGDVLGPGSAFDTQRYHTGIYAHDHYESRSSIHVLDRALALTGEIGEEGPILDAGCATGGTTLHLASCTNRLTLGIDLNFAMLRIAACAMREKRVRYPLRKVGLVYERCETDVELDDDARARADFWCCDAAALPVSDQTFTATFALNLVDCVSDPSTLLGELQRVTRDGHAVTLASPFDWSPNATPYEAWLGGHSQRGDNGGSSESIIRTLLDVQRQANVQWKVRIHERATVDYVVNLVVARARSASATRAS